MLNWPFDQRYCCEKRPVFLCNPFFFFVKCKMLYLSVNWKSNQAIFMKYLVSVFFLAVVFVACQSNTSSNESTLPKARSGEAEVILVMDSAQWQGDLGDAIKETFQARIPGLPQPEPYFSLKYVQPSGFRSILKQAANIVIVMTLNNQSASGQRLKNYFTEESLNRIQEDQDLFMHLQKNVFARGQNVLYLFGQTDEQLIGKVKENDDRIRELFLQAEKERLADRLFSVKGETSLSRKLARDHNFTLRIPSGYELAKEEDNFVWIRMLGEVDKSIVIYYEPYTSENIFEEEEIVALRDKIASEYLVDIEDTSIFMTTETFVLPQSERVNFDGKYAVETRGLWKLSDSTLGGPFISYVLVDEALNRLYYIEGYVASPGQNKRAAIRELEVILKTFETSSSVESS